MGICLGQSCRPPTPDLVGTWILNQESKNFSIHSSPLRQSYKLNCLTNPQLVFKKLTIKSNGFIKYEEYDHGTSFQIEGPAVKWINGYVETVNGSSIRIDYRKAKEGTIIVEDDKMYRA